MQQASTGVRAFGDRVAAFAGACHPAPTLTVAVLAASLAGGLGQPVGSIIGLAVAVLAGQLSVGWLNDTLDAERDDRAGRTDKPVAAGRISRRAVGVAAGVAAVAAVLLTVPFGLRAVLAHTAALVSAWGYDLGLKSTAVSVLPFAVSFGLLPMVVDRGHSPGWLLVAAALLGCAAHFVNVVPDIDEDLTEGVRGLPHRLGAQASVIVAAALVLTVGVLIVIAPAGPPHVVSLIVLPVAVVVLAVGITLGRRPRSRAAFAAVLIVALLDVVAAVVAL
jgi:4-hydroxybenzoate polyprenyltransferase